MASAFQTLGLGEGRKLGTPSGDLERQARRLRRKGYDREAGPLMAQAAILRAQNRGIQSSEAITEKMRLEEQQAEEMVRQQQSAVLGTGAPTTGSAPPSPTTPATTPTAPAPTGQTTAPTGQTTAPTGQTTAPTGQPMIPEARRSFAQIAADRQRELSLAGNFGSVAKARAEKGVNLEQRQSLFAEMRAGKIDSAQARERATALGVDEKGFNTAIARLEGVDTSPATPTPSPAESLSGRALAQKNIAEKGIQGAAADYFKRNPAGVSTAPTAVAYQGSTAAPGTAPRGAPVANPSANRPQIGQAAPRPAAEPARVSAIPQFDDEDFGENIVFREKSMGYNEPAVAKVRGVTSKVDAAMNRAAGAVGERIEANVGAAFGAGKAMGNFAADNLDRVQALSERTNKASRKASNRLQALIK